MRLKPSVLILPSPEPLVQPFAIFQEHGKQLHPSQPMLASQLQRTHLRRTVAGQLDGLANLLEAHPGVESGCLYIKSRSAMSDYLPSFLATTRHEQQLT